MNVLQFPNIHGYTDTEKQIERDIELMQKFAERMGYTANIVLAKDHKDVILRRSVVTGIPEQNAWNHDAMGEFLDALGEDYE